MTSLSLQNIGLKPTQLKAVARRAKKEGQTPSEFVRSLIERELLTGSSFDEILKPIRSGFKQAGVTEAELDTLVAKARKRLLDQKQIIVCLSKATLAELRQVLA